ncbi:MAG: primosomal protein N' [Clostridia bacterium]|nr:primosomal protein N' [Clostridia bacterium]
MRYAKVVVDLNAKALDRLFTYRIPDGMDIQDGDMVSIPFGPRQIEGFVLETSDETDVDSEKLKPIAAKIGEESVILPELLQLAAFMKERYLCTTADALRCMIPAQMRMGRVKQKNIKQVRLLIGAEAAKQSVKRAPVQAQIVELLAQGEMPLSELNQMFSGASAACAALKKKGIAEISEKRVMRAPKINEMGRSASDPVLTAQQQNVVDVLEKALDTGGRFLLYGVTGSGKTEVYIKLIRELLKRGRGAIILVPEIALTPQTVGWFHARFGDLSAVIHSRHTPGERFDEWQRIRSGEAKVVIGARSAVFAPVEMPGAIIIDEEHEGTYLSQSHPYYDARDIALERVRMSGGILLLGSATPSIASYMRTLPKIRPENRLTLLEMDERALGRPLPECELVDMRTELENGNKGIFSKRLIQELKSCMASGKQAMLFINRRGHSTFVNCRACGYVVKCDRCDVAMTYHQIGESLICHYCGQRMPVPKTCPSCKSCFIKFFGAGTQRIQEEAQALFPDKRVLRMDLDTTAGKDAHANILEAFGKGEADILVGTQMIAKGLDFPNVTLVGVVAADTTLNLPDYRSAERTFQLITQVAGRAGRADYPGRVIIQTYSPQHYALQCALKQDYRAFYHQEAAYRKRSLYPPYTTLARLVFSSQDGQKALLAAENAEKELKQKLNEQALTKNVLSLYQGAAPIKRINGLERYELLVKMYTAGDTLGVIGEMEALEKQPINDVITELEINPANLF